VRRDLLPIARVRPAQVGEVVRGVHLRLRERERRRVHDDDPVAVALHEATCVERVRLVVEEPRGLRERHFFFPDFFEGGELDRVLRRRLAPAQEVRDPPLPPEPPDIPPRGERLRDLDDSPLSHAVDEEIRLGGDEHRRLHGVGPVVVVRDAAERRLDAAGDDRHARERLAAPLRVDRGRAVGPLAGAAARRVRVVVSPLPVRRKVVDHRVHVARGDGVEEPRAAERAPRVLGAPVGLREDRDLKALGLEDPAEDRHRERRVVDVGVARHEDDVGLRPSAGAHLLRGGGQEGL